MPEVKVLVEGGKATPAPPLGPSLAPLGVNIGEIVKQINEKTKEFAGMKVPVTVAVDSATKDFEIKIGSPPASELIKREIKIQKGAANPKTEEAGNIKIEQLLKVTKMKFQNMNSYRMKSAVKEIAGTCASLGIRVDGKKAREFQKDVDEGKYDAAIEQAGAA
ncbi:MAG: 50S ribosomal protein L11 [Candidatus Diapherotrites archaeon]|nr:50S ribosomal protein L11 [Candidatus Diapherotrites archaeon]